MAEIFPEVQAAAKWWTDVMSAADTRQDNGDALQSGFASLTRSLVAPLGADERDVFYRVLCDRIQEHITRDDGWERAKTETGWGSAWRYIGVDYGPDRVLGGAADRVAGDDQQQAARISLLWPIKTGMWINPGSVDVRHGYGAKVQRIYPMELSQSVGAVDPGDGIVDARPRA